MGMCERKRERESVCVFVCCVLMRVWVPIHVGQSKISGASLYLSPSYFLKAGSFTEPEAHLLAGLAS